MSLTGCSVVKSKFIAPNFYMRNLEGPIAFDGKGVSTHPKVSY